MKKLRISDNLRAVLLQFDRHLFRYGVDNLARGAVAPTVYEWLNRNGIPDVGEGIGEEPVLMVWNSVVADPARAGEWLHRDLAFTSQYMLRPVFKNINVSCGSITVASVEIVSRSELAGYEEKTPDFADDIAQEFDLLLWRIARNSKTTVAVQ